MKLMMGSDDLKLVAEGKLKSKHSCASCRYADQCGKAGRVDYSCADWAFPIKPRTHNKGSVNDGR